MGLSDLKVGCDKTAKPLGGGGFCHKWQEGASGLCQNPLRVVLSLSLLGSQRVYVEFPMS